MKKRSSKGKKKQDWRRYSIVRHFRITEKAYWKLKVLAAKRHVTIGELMSKAINLL